MIHRFALYSYITCLLQFEAMIEDRGFHNVFRYPCHKQRQLSHSIDGPVSPSKASETIFPLKQSELTKWTSKHKNIIIHTYLPSKKSYTHHVNKIYHLVGVNQQRIKYAFLRSTKYKTFSLNTEAGDLENKSFFQIVI